MKNLIVFIMINVFTLSYSFAQCTVAISNSTNVLCFGICTGQATAIASGGIAPYTYLWSNNNTAQTANGLCAGTYFVTITDSIGCTSTTSISINQPLQIESTIATINSHCGSSDGSITVIATGGAPPYLYSIDGGTSYQANGTFNNLPSGFYLVVVRDGNSCSVTTNIVISDIAPIPPIISTTPTCVGSCTGSATCTIQSGSFPFTFQWSNGAIFPTISNLCPGIYYVSVVDANGCVYVATDTIFESSNAQVYINGNNIICNNEQDTLTARIYCGTAPFIYQWNQGILADSVIIVSPNSNTLYTVTVTDALGSISVDSFSVVINPHCGNIISGYVFDDLNANGIKDFNESGISGKIIKITPSSAYTYTNSNGYYASYDAGIGNYSITIPNPGYNIVSPDTNYSIFSTIGLTDSVNNFALQSVQANDLMISIYSGTARPGFNYQTYLFCKNNGTDTMDAVVKYKYDSTLIYLSTFPSGINFNGDSILWTIQNIAPNYTKQLNISFNIPATTPLGTILYHDAFIYPIIGDSTPNDNYFHLQRTVTGSYDPNDKSVIPEKYMTLQQITENKPFNYTIRFQNTGTDTAFNIKIRDTLSQNLDISSFEMIASSHPYNLKIIGQNIIEWSFENILLPDSNTNEELSHGYVQYRIRPNDNLTLNDIVSNTAYIYFDFNTAVITNTVTDTICETITNIKHQENSKDNITIYPNPFNSLTNIDLTIDNSQEIEISILNSLGEKLEHKKYGKLSNGNHQIVFENKLTKLTCGFYLFEIKIGDKLYYKKAYIY